MGKNDLLKLFKFYHGEELNPFKDKDSAMWWEGEQVYYNSALNNKDFIKGIEIQLTESIRRKYVSEPLNDIHIPKEKRCIIYFLDLWHGKWFPYDDLDKIFEYIKT